MADHDLHLIGGTVVDGTGRPGYRADVAVHDGVVVEIGELHGTATTTIDATGRVVCPGFVDIHTHYDAQIVWDPLLSCSPWHGVTTVLIGSCGFGVAPTRPDHRDTVMRTLEKVEGMSYDALRSGLGADWPFETFPEYLDVLEGRGTLINVAAYVGHTPLRLFVMGDDATERAASEDEVARMQELVADAVDAGAIGFSTSHAATHHGAGGRPVPSRLSTFDEVDALVGTASAHGATLVQAAMGRSLFNDEFAELADRHGVTITWTALLASMAGPGSHLRYLATAREQQAAGRGIVPQVACRPIMFDFNFAEPYPFEMLPAFAEVMVADRDRTTAIYADPTFRDAFRADTAADSRNVNAEWWNRTVVSRYDPDPTIEERSVAELADERGVHPVDLVLDLALDDELRPRFRYAFLNHEADEVRELICDPATVITLSDAGAHADQLCDACWSTHLLGHWVREQQAMPLEQAVHELTQRPAELAGLTDRGLLAVGRPADLVVLDPDTVGATAPRRVDDLPGGTERLVTDPIGIDAVIVNGVVVRDAAGDRLTADDPMPGALLRHGHAARN